MYKLTLILALMLTAPAFVAPPSSAQAEGKATKTATLQIQGMVSKSCPVLVKAAVGKIAGVRKVDATYEKRSATVQYDPARTSTAKIQAVLKDQVGFDSKVTSDR
jgi:mercuric ion binding protein